MRSEVSRVAIVAGVFWMLALVASAQPLAQTPPIQHVPTRGPGSPSQPAPNPAGPTVSGPTEASDKSAASESKPKIEHPLLDFFKPAKPVMGGPGGPLALIQSCKDQGIWRGAYCEIAANTPTGAGQIPEVLSFTEVERGSATDRLVISWPVIGNTAVT